MYFDYQNWRCQLRDKKITPRGPIIGPGGVLKPGQQFRPYTRTEFWFFHFCDGPHNKRFKGPCKSLPPDEKRRYGGFSYQNGYVQKFCQKCSAQAPHEVLDYFAKALELWRLADPKQ